jgi:Flp pilus assembly protein TadB
MIMTPLTVLVGVIPFLGKISRGVASFVGVLLGVALSAIVIAISWILVRPLIGLALLAVAAGFVAMIMFFRKKKTNLAFSE